MKAAVSRSMHPRIKGTPSRRPKSCLPDLNERSNNASTQGEATGTGPTERGDTDRISRLGDRAYMAHFVSHLQGYHPSRTSLASARDAPFGDAYTGSVRGASPTTQRSDGEETGDPSRTAPPCATCAAA